MFTAIECPFCNENEFDLPGLKMHLEYGWCDKYNALEMPSRVGPRSPDVGSTDEVSERE